MPGKVLIVDNIATNRIVKKVKLATACYDVGQATDGAAGLDAAHRLQPDLVLCSSFLPDMTPAEFARALRGNPRTRDISLVVEALQRDDAFRYGVLDAGADDILLKPYKDYLLLARLRSLLRLRETNDDLTLREGACRALGLSETPANFARPGQIALVAPTLETAVKWRGRLERQVSGQLAAFPYKDMMRRISESGPPDAVAMILTPQARDTGLQLLADLRANPRTRDAGVLALVQNGPVQRMAADALDRGASDVITEGFATREIALRLHRQIARRHTLERRRANMHDGLRAAVTDPLTGLFNRRYAMPRLADIADAALRQDRDFAAMLIDVDHFKVINDRFGHATGDTVLTRLAGVLRATVGENDLLARIGGEEFLVALPDTRQTAAQLAARRICQAVRDARFDVPGTARPLQVTVSIGVALLSDVTGNKPSETAAGVPGWPGSDSVSASPLHKIVVDRADRALLSAKAHGRNRVTLSNARSAA